MPICDASKATSCAKLPLPSVTLVMTNWVKICHEIMHVLWVSSQLVVENSDSSKLKLSPVIAMHLLLCIVRAWKLSSFTQIHRQEKVMCACVFISGAFRDKQRWPHSILFNHLPAHHIAQNHLKCKSNYHMLVALQEKYSKNFNDIILTGANVSSKQHINVSYWTLV